MTSDSEIEFGAEPALALEHARNAPIDAVENARDDDRPNRLDPVIGDAVRTRCRNGKANARQPKHSASAVIALGATVRSGMPRRAGIIV